MRRFGKEEEQALIDVIRSADKTLSYYSFSYYAEGGQVHKFEQEFAGWLGVKYCCAVNSGTSALFVALGALGIYPHWRISIPAYTFVADAEAVVQHRAIPDFRDIDKDTYCAYDYDGKSKVFIPVHTLGNMVNPAVIMAAKEGGVKVLEDCAQCVGGAWNGKRAGIFGDISIFSCQGTKNLTTGEGGLIATDNEELYERCCALRNHGDYYKAKFPHDKYKDLPMRVGWNLRMTELQAAVGRCQLAKLDGFLASFKKNAKLIFDLLPDGIAPPYIPEEVDHGYFILGCKWLGVKAHKKIFLDRLLVARRKQGLLYSDGAPDIPGSNQPPGYSIGGGYSQPLYDLPLYKRYERHCPNVVEVISRAIWIDIHRFTDEKRIMKEMEIFNRVYKEVERTQ